MTRKSAGPQVAAWALMVIALIKDLMFCQGRGSPSLSKLAGTTQSPTCCHPNCCALSSSVLQRLLTTVQKIVSVFAGKPPTCTIL